MSNKDWDAVAKTAEAEVHRVILLGLFKVNARRGKDVVEKPELAQALMQASKLYWAPKGYNLAFADSLFHQLDVTQSGKVSVAEFENHVCRSARALLALCSRSARAPRVLLPTVHFHDVLTYRPVCVRVLPGAHRCHAPAQGPICKAQRPGRHTAAGSTGI
eukprot:7384872-Prymnesium_polylepis.1